MKSIIVCLVAVLMFGGCTRRANQYGNAIVQRYSMLRLSLTRFENAPDSSATARAVVKDFQGLLETMGMVDLATLRDIQKMTPQEAEKWAQEYQDRLSPIQRQIGERMAAIRQKIASDEHAPTWFPADGMPASAAYYGRPVYRISGGKFYFMDWSQGFDVEAFNAGFDPKAHFLAVHSGKAFKKQ